MHSSVDAEAKTHTIARIAGRIDSESKTLPYRWGYFQGAFLIPWSLLILLGVFEDLQKHHEPWYLITIALLMGFLGLPLAYGLLRKKSFALVLVYVMFGLSLLLLAIKIPVAVKHFTDPGDNSSAFVEAELLLFWLLSMVYYRRRRAQFH